MGRDIELQNTHIVLFKSPRDVLLINTLSQQLGLGLQLKDWYTKATSIPYGHLLIDLTPKTDNSLRFCTNSSSIPTFFLPKTKQEITFLNNEHTTSLYADNVSNVFPEIQENVPKKLSKRFHSVSKRMLSKPSLRTTTGNTKTRRNKVQRRNSSTRAKKNRNKKKKSNFKFTKRNRAHINFDTIYH